MSSTKCTRLPHRRRYPDDGPRHPADSDPITDVDALVEEISETGMDPHRAAFISFHVRFQDRSRWERAAAAAGSAWQVSMYSRPGAHMLRLSRQADMTPQTVGRLRAAVRAFAAEQDAVWESVTVEELSGTNEWKALDAQQRAALLSVDEDLDEVAGAVTGLKSDAPDVLLDGSLHRGELKTPQPVDEGEVA